MDRGDLEHKIEAQTEPELDESPPNKRIGSGLYDQSDDESKGHGSGRPPSRWPTSIRLPPRPPQLPIAIASEERNRDYLPYVLSIAGMLAGLFGAYEFNKTILENHQNIQIINYMGCSLIGFSLPLLVYKKIKSK